MPTVDELNIKIEAEAEKANSALDRLIGNFSSLSSGLRGINLRNLEEIPSSTGKAAKEVKNTKKEIFSSANAIKSFSKQFSNVGKDFKVPSTLADVRKEILKTEKSLDNYSEKESRMIDIGAKLDSQGFKGLQRDISEALNRLDALLVKEKELISINESSFNNIRFHGLSEKDVKSDSAPRITTVDASDMGYNVEAMKAVFGEGYADIKNWNQALEKLGANAGKVFNGLTQNISFANSEISGANSNTQLLKNTMDLFKSSFANLPAIASSGLQKGISGLGSALKGIPSGLMKIGSTLKSSVGRLNLFKKSSNNAFGGGLKNVLKYGLGIRSLFVLFNRLRNMMKEGFNNLAQYSDETNNSLSSVKSSLTQFKNSLAVAFNPLLTAVAPALTSFINLMSSALNKFGQFIAALTGKSSAVQSLKVSEDYASGLSNETGKTADNVKKIQKGIRSFDELKTISIGNESDSGSSGTSSGTNVSDMFETVDISSNISGFAEQVKEAWKNADFTEIGTIFGTKLNSALSDIKWDKIKETVKNIASSVATFLNGFIGETDWALVGSTFSEGVNTAIGGVKTFIDKFDWKSLGSAVVTGITSFFANIEWDQVGGTLSSAIQGLFDFFTGVFEGINWSELPGKIIDGITDFFDGFDWKGTFKSIGETIGTVVSSALDLGKAIIDSIGDIGKRIKDYFIEHIKEATDGLDEDASVLEVGAAIIGGVFNGIAEFFKNVGTWFKDNILTPFVNGFKKAFDIHSPSQKPEIVDLGKNIFLGIVEGFKGAFSGITTAFTEFFENYVKPWFTVEKWISVFGSIKNALSAKWEEAKTWWNENKPSLNKVIPSFSDIKASLKEKWNSAKTWWNDNKPSLDKVSPTIENLKNKLKSAWTTAKEWWNKNVKLKIPKLNFHVEFKKPSGVIQKAVVKALSLDGWPSLRFFASGGFPEDGTFRASHGEIMGRFDNGKSVVANNKQITDGISAAVYQGNRENNTLLRQEIQLLQAQNELLSRILEKDTGISANDLFDSVRKSSREYFNRTGNPAFVY